MNEGSLGLDSALNAIGPIWNLSDPLSFRPLAGGTNNSVQLVETGSGNYVVRLYRNHTDPARLRFEHAVLIALQTLELPFAIPTPIPTPTGERYAWVNTGEGNDVLVTLTARIAGSAPSRSNLKQAEAAGEALGVLDLALDQISCQLPGEGISWRSYGDLAHCHPLVPDPYQGIVQLPVAEEVKQRLLARYQWLTEQIPSLYASLPVQLSHEDYAPSNILMQETRVTGVLDFEFCSRDLRAMDLTVALSWWPVSMFGTGEEWPIIEAFGRGYARKVKLTIAEVAAVPVLYQLRAYTSLIHRLGRYLQGVSPLEAVIGRAYAAREREVWLARHEARLLELLQDVLVSRG
ncbi:MAG: phosphotransferase [Ktedonobacterales bacterium]